jgi:2-keto-4-pentenoate hydratase
MSAPGRPWVRRGHGGLEPLALSRADLPETLEAAYRALAAFQAAEPDLWGGWKIGGSNHASRAALGVDRPCYGALMRAEIAAEPAAAPPRPLPELKGEVEIALRIDSSGAGFDAWCVALEMPASAIADLPGLGVVALVADRCAAGALLLGPPQSGSLPGPSARFGQRINGTPRAEAGLEALVATPPSILAEFLAMARGHGAPVVPGHWVATGGITPCLAYAPGDRVEVTLDGRVVLEVAIAGAGAARGTA